MSLKTPLARAKGLGSAKEGVSHWWAQRVTAIALVPLMLWLAFSIAGLVGLSHGEVVDWMSHPVNTALLILALIAVFYHSELGLQVIIEDYVHAEGLKIAGLLVMKFAMYFLGTLSVVSVLRVAFGG